MKKETEVFILSNKEKEIVKTILNNIISHTKKEDKEDVFETFISKTQFIFSPEGLECLKEMRKILA